MHELDLLIIGSGPGGHAAARSGAKAGLKTAIVERGLLGGTCLNWGCIPTKLFLGATEPVDSLVAQRKLRIASGEINIDLNALQKRKTSLLSATRKAIAREFDSLGVEIIQGEAGLKGSGRVEVRTENEVLELSGKNIILATGSRPASLPGITPDHNKILDSNDLLELKEIPASMAVIGAGAIGLEMGRFLHRMGCRITLIEAMQRIAPAEDEEISAEIRKILKREKWDVRAGCMVSGIKDAENGLKISLKDEDKEIEVEKCLLAAGRRPSTDNLGLDHLREIKQDKGGWLQVDDYLRSAEGVYAIGDVNNICQLAHAASDQAEFAIRHILGKMDKPYPQKPIPSCVYGPPDIMRTGMTETELKKQGRDCVSTRAQLVANPICQAHGAGYGLIKVIWEKGRVIGISAVGHNVSHLVSLAQNIVDDAWDRKRAEKLVFAHPTLDESLKEALLAEPAD
ncbi:MAG: dihydrolipoyl dehydrogenase family protein [Thermodesulfobacteriota bacterium]